MIGVQALSSDKPAGARGIYGLMELPDEEARAAISDMAASASLEEKQAFRDGRITYDEYEAAVQRNISCMRAAVAGIGPVPITLTVHGPDTSPDRFRIQYSYAIETGTSLVDQGVMQQITDAEIACQERTMRQTEHAYQVGWRTDTNRVAEVSETFAACMRDNAGLDLKPDAAADEVLSALEQADPRGAGPCLEQAPAVGYAMAWERDFRPSRE